MVARFGPWNIPKCLENGPFGDQRWVENGSKTRFCKNDPGPFMMLKQVVLAHRECSDADLRQIIETHQGAKQLRWRWIPSHRVIKRCHAEKKKDIKHNDVVDRLPKLAAKLPLPEAPLAGHEWAVAILHAYAINASRKGRPRDGNESGTDGNTAHKRRKI